MIEKVSDLVVFLTDIYELLYLLQTFMADRCKVEKQALCKNSSFLQVQHPPGL